MKKRVLVVISTEEEFRRFERDHPHYKCYKVSTKESVLGLEADLIIYVDPGMFCQVHNLSETEFQFLKIMLRTRIRGGVSHTEEQTKQIEQQKLLEDKKASQ